MSNTPHQQKSYILQSILLRERNVMLAVGYLRLFVKYIYLDSLYVIYEVNESDVKNGSICDH